MSNCSFIGGIIKKIINEYSHDELKTMMTYPDISPLDSDQTWEAWLYRLTIVWGNVIIKLNDPENDVNGKSVSHKEFLNAIGNDEELKVYGLWSIDSVEVNKLKVYRNYLAYDGKRYTKSFDIEVKLKSGLQKALDNAKHKGLFGWFTSKFK